MSNFIQTVNAGTTRHWFDPDKITQLRESMNANGDHELTVFLTDCRVVEISDPALIEAIKAGVGIPKLPAR